jgi:hypothetical protein
MSNLIDISSTLSRRDTTYTVALDDDDNLDKGLLSSCREKTSF